MCGCDSVHDCVKTTTEMCALVRTEEDTIVSVHAVFYEAFDSCEQVL